MSTKKIKRKKEKTLHMSFAVTCILEGRRGLYRQDKLTSWCRPVSVKGAELLPSPNSTFPSSSKMKSINLKQ